jgi:hypothetical protein
MYRALGPTVSILLPQISPILLGCHEGHLLQLHRLTLVVGRVAQLAIALVEEEDWPTCSISVVGIQEMSLNRQTGSVRLCPVSSQTRQTMVDLPDEEPPMEVLDEKKPAEAVELWAILIHMKVEEVQAETMTREFLVIAGKYREASESHRGA